MDRLHLVSCIGQQSTKVEPERLGVLGLTRLAVHPLRPFSLGF
jgi:hypothetical protein